MQVSYAGEVNGYGHSSYRYEHVEVTIAPVEPDPAAVTDHQIRMLSAEAAIARDYDQFAMCALALDGSIWPDDHRDISTRMAARLADMTQAQARVECARVIAAAQVQS